MNDEQKERFEIYLQEYSKLKDEQIQRIVFRDQLIYITLGVFGGILAFALGENVNPYALIVFPWVSIVLGWTYLINDEKISRIGEYIRKKLSPRMEKLSSEESAGKTKPIFGWEKYYRKKGQRNLRKIVQLLINEITFVFSGIFILQAFKHLKPKPQGIVLNILRAEWFFLILLGLAIFVYADLNLPKINLINLINEKILSFWKQLIAGTSVFHKIKNRSTWHIRGGEMGTSLLQHWARVLIITVIEPELEAILKVFDLKKKDHDNTKNNTNIRYWQSRLELPYKNTEFTKFYDVIITSLDDEAGNVNAGIKTCQFIHEWHPDLLLLVGVAGAGTRSKLGDIVIGREISYIALATEESKETRPRPQRTQADQNLLRKLPRINDRSWELYLEKIPKPDIDNLADPRIHNNVIASGERLIKSQEKRNQIIADDDQVRAIAMEDYGVYRAAKIWNPQVKCLSIRAISDWADGTKNDELDEIWQPYAAEVAASYAKYYLLNAPIECEHVMEPYHRQKLDQNQIEEYKGNFKSHYDEIKKSLENGNVIFFLGSGVNLLNYSKADNLASEIDINNHLYKSYNNEDLIGFPCLVCHETLNNRPRGCRIRDKYTQSPEGEDCPLFRIQQLEIAKNVNRYLSQYEHWDNTNVHMNASEFIRDQNKTQSNKIHDFIAKYFTFDRRKDKSTLPNLIVTTNYDCALENAFENACKKKDQKFYVIVYVANTSSLNSGKFVYKCSDEDQYKIFQNLNDSDKSEQNKAQNEYREIFNKYPVIIKLFGSVEENSIDDKKNYPGIVLTEEDHINYLRHREKVIPLAQLLPSCIKDSLNQKNLLFLGYNPTDEDLRVILNRLCGQARKSSKKKKGAPEGWLIHQSKLGCFETKFWKDWNIKPETFPLEIYISNLNKKRIQKP